jgi:hypothetical protein
VWHVLARSRAVTVKARSRVVVVLARARTWFVKRSR